MSRSHRVVALILLCVPGLIGQTGPANANKDRAARKPKQYTIEQFMNSVKLGGASFSPDDKEIVFHSNKTGIYNVFSLPVTGGTPKQITNSTKESTFVIGFFPTDRRLLYTYDQGGNENDHIYVRELSGAERDLTPGEKVKATFAGWTKDRKGFYYQTNERDPKFMDLYRMEVEGYKRKLIFRNPGAFDLGAISGDEKWVALVKNNTTADTEIHLFSAASGEINNITPAKKTETLYSAEDFNAESTHLYFTTNQGSEFTYVARYEVASGKIEPVEKFDWDVTATFFSWNGKYRVTTINEDARTKLRIVEQATGREVKLPDLPQGDITGIRISPSEKLAAFYLNGDRAPADLYIYDFQRSTANRLTHSLNPQIDAADLVEAEVRRFKSFDGMQIPNILFKPHQASASHKVPALVWVHGGPGGQTRKGYSAAFQFLANHGYVILGINNRGSSGYGQSFFTADDGKHGREPLWDCIEAKKYLQSLEYVDPDRIGIIGGSYGGYMVLAALAFRPEEFHVGVDIFGVANWVRTLESIPPYWESFREALYKEIGNPATQKDLLREVSPLFHAHKIKRPLLVLQGANDPRVIKPESDDIVEAVKKNLVPVEYIVFEDEGHGFTKKVNEVKAWGSILEFLDKHLKTGSGQHAPRK